MRKPKQIDLLLSSKDNRLMSDKVVDSKDRVKLYSGPLGTAFLRDIASVLGKSCSYPATVIPMHSVSVKRAWTIRATLSDRKILEYFKEEIIGAECSPKCGSCACGKCPTGAQQMSIKEEKARGSTGAPTTPGWCRVTTWWTTTAQSSVRTQLHLETRPALLLLLP